MKTIEEITRRLLGRYLATIDNVTGNSGQSPAIVITWSDKVVGDTRYCYDSNREYFDALSVARSYAASYFKTHDVCDNTL